MASLLHIFLAGPLHAHQGAGHSLRDADRLLHVFIMQPAPPKATARVHFVDDDFVERHARCFRRCSDTRFTILRANPHFDTVAFY